MNEIIQIETLVLELLLIVSVVAILVRRFRIPYTVALVLAGLALSFRSPLRIDLTPELILSLLIPPLVFEAAYHLNLGKLRKNLTTIGLLAVPGVILTMLIVGVVVSWGAGMPLGIALIFGALIAATDPVSVVALFRKMGAPKRLEVLLEGESLFNDGTAIVIFDLAVSAFLVGAFSLRDAVFDFGRVAGGGILVGVLLGWISARLIARIDDHLVETTLTTVLAFGSFLVAESLHVSGVLAVVAAGLVNGNIASEGMSPTTRIIVLNFWEYVAFLANSAVFLMIGLDIDLGALLAAWRPILWAIGGVLIARGVGIYLLSRLGRDIPTRWRHVMFWGGLRGAIALALALSLPAALGAARETVILMTFGVVLFSLLGQGLTMDWLMRRLRLIVSSDEQIEYEKRRARALAAQASQDHLRRLHQEGMISSHTWDRMSPILNQRIEALTRAVQEALRKAPQLEFDEVETARREMLRAQRNMIADLRRDGVISDETHEDLVSEIDLVLDTRSDYWPSQAILSGPVPAVDSLVVAVVQDLDLESVLNALAIRGIPVTRIQSRGGFLRESNHLLLVGVAEEHLEEAVSALRRASRERVRFVDSPLGSSPVPVAAPTEVKIHGVTVFVFKVNRYEVL